MIPTSSMYVTDSNPEAPQEMEHHRKRNEKNK
jgi:hypothetical protein